MFLVMHQSHPVSCHLIVVPREIFSLCFTEESGKKEHTWNASTCAVSAQFHAVGCLVSYHVAYRAMEPSCFRVILSLFSLNFLFPWAEHRHTESSEIPNVYVSFQNKGSRLKI